MRLAINQYNAHLAMSMLFPDKTFALKTCIVYTTLVTQSNIRKVEDGEAKYEASDYEVEEQELPEEIGRNDTEATEEQEDYEPPPPSPSMRYRISASSIKKTDKSALNFVQT
nr:hypothetical protein HmN_000908100 [Hymenolepis microstoma]